MNGMNSLTFEQAIGRTIPKEPKTFTHYIIGTNLFQLFVFLSVTMGMYSAAPLIDGMPYLEKEPNSFKCYYDPNY